MDPTSRTDTVRFILPSERPLPARLSPRAELPSALRIARALLIAVAIVVGAMLTAFLLPIAAFLIPQPVLVALIVLAVGYEVARRAKLATAARS